MKHLPHAPGEEKGALTRLHQPVIISGGNHDGSEVPKLSHTSHPLVRSCAAVISSSCVALVVTVAPSESGPREDDGMGQTPDLDVTLLDQLGDDEA